MRIRKSIAASLSLLIVYAVGHTACVQSPSTGTSTEVPEARTVPAVDVGSPDGRPAPPLTASLTTNRPLIIRGDSEQGGALLSATASQSAAFVWTHNDEGGLLDFDLPDPNTASSTTSALEIRGVNKDPGAKGTRITFTVEITEVRENAQAIPLVRKLTIEVVRAEETLTAKIERTAGNVSPGNAITFTARISGGRPFSNGQIPTCTADDDGEGNSEPGSVDGLQISPRNNGEPYNVTWEVFQDSELLSGISTVTAKALCNDDGTIVAELVYLAPLKRGALSIKITVTDSSGAANSDSTSVIVSSTGALSPLQVGQAIAAKPTIAPGEPVVISAEPTGGEPPFSITFSLDPDGLGGSLSGTGCGALESGACTVDYTAAFTQTGSEIITIVITDAVGNVVQDTITVSVDALLELDLNVASQAAGAQPNTSVVVESDVIGGVPPYTVCYLVDDSFGELSTGTSGCGPIVAGEFTFANCTCDAGTATSQGLDPVVVERTYTAPSRAGNAVIRVAVNDSDVPAKLVTTLLTIPVSSAEVDPGGGAGEVQLFASIDNSISTVCLGESTTISANVEGGVGPFNFTHLVTPVLALTGESLVSVSTSERKWTATYTAHSEASRGKISRTINFFVTEPGGSNDSVAINVTTPGAPVAVAGSHQPAICRSSAPLTLGGVPTASGGTFPYSYEWTAKIEGDPDPVPAWPVFSDPTAANPDIRIADILPLIPAGPAPVVIEATVQVTDDCNRTATATMTIELVDTPTADAGTPATICENDVPLAVVGLASGGTAPYSFAWSGNGASFLSSTTISNPTFDPQLASPGDWTLVLTVEDDSGCLSPATSTTTITVQGLPGVSAGPDRTLATNNRACVDGQAFPVGGTPTAFGGTLPFSYTWSGTGATHLTLDPDPLNNANPSFDPAAAGVGPFEVCVEVEDGIGCTSAAADCAAIEVFQSNCGNFIRECNEICDEGDVLDGGFNGLNGHCAASCGAVEGCGDGVVNGTEVCDDGDLNGSGEGFCVKGCGDRQICGDSTVQAAPNGTEACDDGDLISSGEGDCLADCSGIQTCGDNDREGTEACDDGDTISNGEGFCLFDCSGLQQCGDGDTEGTEFCDDGAANGTGAGVCNLACTRTQTCGDGFKDGTESCDDGANNGSGPGVCNGTCTRVQSCGDGTTDGTESCDDGPANGTGAGICNATCTRTQTCGDGFKDGTESCDAGGNNGSGPGVCNNTCTRLQTCGDGIPDGTEACDVGAANGTGDGICNESCTRTQTCGDGFQDGTESCDAGADNGSGPGVCNSTCTRLQTCGDGIMDGTESCDDGALNGTGAGVCNESCTRTQSCGDGFQDGTESCDDGGDNGSGPGVCNSACTRLQTCGDGIMDGTESCDDGALNGTGAGVCNESCTRTQSCGDGFQDGTESCDDGGDNGSGPGVCNSTCTRLQTCGDGIVDGTEFCDVGAANGTGDGICNESCTRTQTCGDGFQDGTESCDAGGDNGSGPGVCNSTCTRLQTCGDGIVDGTEFCDGGNECRGGQGPAACSCNNGFEADDPPTVDCVTAIGACCNVGTCTDESESSCTGGGGTYEGDETDCGSFTCP